MTESYLEATLRRVIADYEATKDEALARRDATLREFHAHGWRPVDIQRVTGYSRETVRQVLHPEARRSVNDSRRRRPLPADAASPGERPPPGYVPYGDRKPYVVVESLDELRGPTHGVVRLPHHLDWSGTPTYDLDRPGRAASMYRTVIGEAASVEDLRRWLNGELLVELWPTLTLPRRAQELWEGRFRQLFAGSAMR